MDSDDSKNDSSDNESIAEPTRNSRTRSKSNSPKSRSGSNSSDGSESDASSLKSRKSGRNSPENKSNSNAHSIAKSNINRARSNSSSSNSSSQSRSRSNSQTSQPRNENRSSSSSRSRSNSSNRNISDSANSPEKQNIQSDYRHSPLKGPKSPSENSGSPTINTVPKSPSPEKLSYRNSKGPRSPSPNEPESIINNKYQSKSGNNESGKNRRTRSRNSSASSSSGSSDGSLEQKSVNSTSTGKLSRRSNRSGKKSNRNSSDSSSSSDDSSNRKNILVNTDVQPEEISDGDMESDDEKPPSETEKELKAPAKDLKIEHEDLSDVSDLDDSIGCHSDEEVAKKEIEEIPPQNIETREFEVQRVKEETTRTEEVEEQLDFEAEDGECENVDESKCKDSDRNGNTNGEDAEKTAAEIAMREAKKREDLEEGEVSDEDDARPEETEPRPVCRFFSRGQCTWGASCRFLHPGVTDKGNYTMFDIVRPMVPGEYDRVERTYGSRMEAAQVESAWERGLRTAKEMVRKSIKRKEQDIDFEEKKMNLSLAQEEFDKENGYYGRAQSPETSRYVRHAPIEYPSQPLRVPPEEYYGRRQVVYEGEYVPRERVRSYRELPSHKMPDYYNNKYEEEPILEKASRKSKREVIVQRAERDERPTRGDEWSDPWMRSKSPPRKGGRKRSFSSGSSYSSSSSSNSSTSRSSYQSRSGRRQSRSRKGRHVSPSVIVSERKAANERAAMMNPPAPRKRAPSPGMLRTATAANPPAPPKEDHIGRARTKLAVAAAIARARSRRSSRSSSESSGSSSSDSDSSGSSSSSSRDGSPAPRRGVDLSIVKAMDALKGNSAEKRQIKLNLKTPLSSRKELADLSKKLDQTQSKKRLANSPPPGDPKSKKATSRREELLKQLKAVEDAIAKKRSKVN